MRNLAKTSRYCLAKKLGKHSVSQYLTNIGNSNRNMNITKNMASVPYSRMPSLKNMPGRNTRILIQSRQTNIKESPDLIQSSNNTFRPCRKSENRLNSSNADNSKPKSSQ